MVLAMVAVVVFVDVPMPLGCATKLESAKTVVWADAEEDATRSSQPHFWARGLRHEPKLCTHM